MNSHAFVRAAAERVREGEVRVMLGVTMHLSMGALAIVDRLLRGNFELGIKITLGFFPMRS